MIAQIGYVNDQVMIVNVLVTVTVLMTVSHLNRMQRLCHFILFNLKVEIDLIDKVNIDKLL